MTLRGVTNALLAALIAPPCAVCAAVLEAPLEGAVCEACWGRLPRSGGLPIQPGRHVTNGCAIGEYEGTLREIIHALKYDARRSVAPRLSHVMAAHGRHLLQRVDLAVPVPLHPRRLRERGFNQAEDLANGLGLPVARALRRIRSTLPQVDLPAAARHRNVQDAFAVSRPAWLFAPARHVDVQSRTIILVDDVTTTGATLEGCARVLLAAGAREVRALTAARVATARR